MAYLRNEMPIECECEETVIDVECDASTMTDVSAIGTQGKSSYAVKMLDTRHSNIRNKNSSKSNILGLISEQEINNKPSYFFNSSLLAFKTSRLNSDNFFITTHPEFLISDCEFIRSGQDNRSVIGLWKSDQYNALMYKIMLNISPRSSSWEDDSPTFIKSIEHQGPYFSNSDVKDMCDTTFNGEKHVVYVGNNYKDNSFCQASVILISFTRLSPTIGQQYITMRDLVCCCGTKNRDTFAAGTNEGVFIYQGQDFIFNNQYTGRVNSVEFNSAGNVLYCGIDHPGLTIFDRREHPFENHTIQIDNLNSVGILETKLLSDENTMIVSGHDGSLSQIDLRKRDTVLRYPGHAGSNKKVPFSFSENVDLLCATGTDKLTRLWSLSTGKQLYAIQPQLKSQKVHSCLISDENRWSVAIFQKNKMYTVEPAS